MKNRISGLEIAGIMIIYLGNFFILTFLIYDYWIGYGTGEDFIIFTITCSSIISTILYNMGILKNKVLVGILGILVSFFGGILVLISPKITFSPEENNGNKIQSHSASDGLLKLKKLLDEGIISKEVYDEKSKKYIEEL